MGTKYQIDGMTCNHCIKTVEKVFLNEGIQAKAELDSKSVFLEAPLAETIYPKIKKALEEEGYTLGNIK